MLPLPRGEHPPTSVLVPALVAAAWWGVLAMAQSSELATQRSLVFLGGPLLLLSGLHARLHGYLHAPERIGLLPLPIDPLRHFEQARRRHLPELALSLLLGVAAVLAAALSAGSGTFVDRALHGLALAGDFAWLGLFAWWLEPGIAAASALLGRRFPEGSRERELQRTLGGGWTTAEAVVHLYAPAFGIAIAVALAMPGQLGLERWIDAGSLDGSLIALGLAPLLVALLVRVAAPRAYARGVWEAVPWLAEATRTIAGPPQPEPSPAWIRGIRDPWSRLLVVQFVRLTPLPMLRLSALLGFGAWLCVRDGSPTGPSIAALAALIGLWLIPARTLARQRPSRARLGGALPLDSARRAGGAGRAVGLLFLPVTLCVAGLALRWLITA
ncbi:hypothetical protein ACNOYE_40045 [Nannocystaceae bacterium ST9]